MFEVFYQNWQMSTRIRTSTQTAGWSINSGRDVNKQSFYKDGLIKLMVKEGQG